MKQQHKESLLTVLNGNISNGNPHRIPHNHIAISYETKINTTDEDVEKGSAVILPPQINPCRTCGYLEFMTFNDTNCTSSCVCRVVVVGGGGGGGF